MIQSLAQMRSNADFHIPVPYSYILILIFLMLKLGLNIGAVPTIHHFCFHHMCSQFLKKEWTKINSNNGIVNIQRVMEAPWTAYAKDQNLDL